MNDNRREPLTVTHLRAQIRRGVSLPVLHRLAGGVFEFDRLNALYHLRPKKTATVADILTETVAAPPPPKLRKVPGSLSSRQESLLALVTRSPIEGEMFVLLKKLASLYCCDWLVVERDLQKLEKRGLIRIGGDRLDGKWIRRVDLPASQRPIATPASLSESAMSGSGVGGVDG